MGYLHIENLDQAPEFLECYALEKIHGTSAHLAFKGGRLRFAAGGEDHARFIALFDAESIRAALAAKFTVDEAVTIFGEAFTGKQQGMSATYGEHLRFLAFDVKVGEVWLDVPAAASLAAEVGVGFVPFERGPLRLEWLDGQRDRDSEVALAPGKIREGVVVRPVRELVHKDGGRVIYKHKRDEFRETATPRAVDPGRVAVIAEAGAIAEEYVTPMRLEHVLQRVPFRSAEDTGAVIFAMQEDVERESRGDVAWSKDAAKAVGKATARLLHKLKSGGGDAAS